MRSSGGSAQLVNDQTVQRQGSSAAATVIITFQKTKSREGVDDAAETAQVSLPGLTHTAHSSAKLGMAG